MKTFLGFTTGLLTGLIAGVTLAVWVYQKPEESDSKED